MDAKKVDWLKRLQILLKALKKNGVKADVWVELETKISGYDLDFTEHDKVFEDKIAKLEKENKALNSYLVQREQDSTDMIMKLKQEKSDKNEKIAELACENELLKQRIAELESKETSELPFDPLECANYLINATYERETSSLERGWKGLPEKVNSDRYTVDELEQIAEHLLVYCKHNKESE